MLSCKARSTSSPLRFAIFLMAMCSAVHFRSGAMNKMVERRQKLAPSANKILSSLEKFGEFLKEKLGTKSHGKTLF